ncbi:MAG: hypothetical protein ABWY12_18965 [Burkholderiales bacterium]
MALAHTDLMFPHDAQPFTHDAQPSRPGLFRLAVTLTVIAACYVVIAWETLPGSWPW